MDCTGRGSTSQSKEATQGAASKRWQDLRFTAVQYHSIL